MLFLLDLTRSWSLDFTELLLVLTESAWEGIFKFFFFWELFVRFLSIQMEDREIQVTTARRNPCIFMEVNRNK